MVTPFVDPSGEPSVLIRMDSYLARAMVLSFIEAAQAGPPRQDGGSYAPGP